MFGLPTLDVRYDTHICYTFYQSYNLKKAYCLKGPILYILYFFLHQKPMVPRTDLHCITTWFAHFSVKFAKTFAYFVASC